MALKSIETLLNGTIFFISDGNLTGHVYPPLVYQAIPEQSIVRIIDNFNTIIPIDISIDTINGVAFSGNYAQLQIDIEAAVNAANIEFENFNSAVSGGSATADNQVLQLDQITDYLGKKAIGKIVDLAADQGGTWNGYPITFLPNEQIGFNIKIDNVEYPIPNDMPADNATELVSLLNSSQSYLYFERIDETHLLISDGTLSISSLEQFYINSANNGVLLYETFTNSTAVPLSNLDVINENIKKLTTLVNQVESLVNQVNELAKLTDTQPTSLKNDFYSDVARNLISGVANFKKQGFNSGVTTTQRMLNSGGTAIVPLTVAAAISFVSNGAGAGNDTAAGTGARSLLITGVDASGNYQTETLVLNGTTPVVTTKTWLGVLNRVQVLTAGTGRVNAGTITGTSGGNTYCTMQPGICLMKQLCYYVPTGKTALIHSYLFDTSKNGGGSIIFNIYFYVLINGVKTELYVWRMDAATASLNIISRAFECPIAIPANTIWWVEASTSSSTGWLDGEIEQVIFDN